LKIIINPFEEFVHTVPHVNESVPDSVCMWIYVLWFCFGQ